MELIRVKDTNYDEYETLLLQKEQLKKEAFKYKESFYNEFGDKIVKLFELKLECIKKKKTIGFIQMSLNKGEAVNQAELDEYIAKEMEEYERELNDMITLNNLSKSGEVISDVTVMNIKKLYRKLAKLLHPDINPHTENLPELMELWLQVQAAYNFNDFEGLQELEVLVKKALKDLGDGVLDVEIPNILEKIEKLKEDILKIRTTDPYTYKFLLEDVGAVSEKHKELDAEIKEYEDYSKELDEVADNLMMGGLSFIWKMD